MWRSFGSGVVGSIASSVIVLCGRVFSWECAVVKREVRCGILFQLGFLVKLITNQTVSNSSLSWDLVVGLGAVAATIKSKQTSFPWVGCNNIALVILVADIRSVGWGEDKVREVVG